MVDEGKPGDDIHPDIAAAVSNAESALESIAETQTEIETSLQVIEQSRNEAEVSAEETKTQLNVVHAILEQVKTTRDEILTNLEKTKTDYAQTSEIARTADEKDKRVQEYETELNELNVKFEEMHSKLQSLLPAATGVGLAKSFNSRKEALKPSLKGYITLFLLSISGFIGFGMWALFSGEINSINDFIIFALERSPIIIGLVLLEEFSRRQFHSTAKLEEDYAFKETISIAFDGYQKAMSDIDLNAPDTLATNLSQNVLETLNQRPGRLMETEKQHELTASKILEAVSSSGENSNKIQAITQVFKELQKGLRVSWIRYAGIIAITLSAGIAIGYYFVNDTRSPVGAHKIENSTAKNT